jgi:hypothetical protein
VLDVDGVAGEESFAVLTRRHGLLPRTATCLTGRDGWHLYFRVESGVMVPNRVGLWPSIDIRGDGGYVVAPGSLHANGNVYRWINRPSGGIAGMPRWLLKAILAGRGPGARSALEEVATGRAGDAGALAAGMIARFPVRGPGRRHGQMVRVVVSLSGRGYHRDLVLDVVDLWHEEFRGIARTGAMAARREAEACLASTLAIPRFGRGVGASADHRASCDRIELGAGVRDFIGSGRIPKPPGDSPNCKRVIAFVEALVIHATHKVNLGEFSPADPDAVVVMTHDQVRAIARRRRGAEWDNRQFERLKSKYVGRPNDGKPAVRFELLREKRKGRKSPGGPAGIASAYVATGIRALLAMG